MLSAPVDAPEQARRAPAQPRQYKAAVLGGHKYRIRALRQRHRRLIQHVTRHRWTVGANHQCRRGSLQHMLHSKRHALPQIPLLLTVQGHAVPPAQAEKSRMRAVGRAPKRAIQTGRRRRSQHPPQQAHLQARRRSSAHGCRQARIAVAGKRRLRKNKHMRACGWHLLPGLNGRRRGKHMRACGWHRIRDHVRGWYRHTPDATLRASWTGP